jgi:hypothetical protein
MSQAKIPKYSTVEEEFHEAKQPLSEGRSVILSPRDKTNQSIGAKPTLGCK